MNTVEIRVRINGSGAISEMTRIERQSQDSANRTGSAWSRVSGILGSVGTGFAKAFAASSVLSMGSALGAAGLAVGAFAALAYPSLDKIKQAALPLVAQFNAMALSLRPMVMGVTDLAVKTGSLLMPAFGQLAKAGGNVLESVLKPMNRLFASDFFHGFINQMSDLAEQVAPDLGRGLAGLLKQFMKLFIAIGPAGARLISELFPALENLVADLTPVIAGLAKLAAQMFHGKSGSAALEGALIALGAAWLVGFGPVGWVIGLMAGLFIWFERMDKSSTKFRDTTASVSSAVIGYFLKMYTITLDVLHGIADTFLNSMLVIAKAASLIPGPWQAAMKKTAGGLEILRNKVDDIFNGLHRTLENWRDAVARMPSVIRIKGDINDLTAKVNSAERQLNNPNLTRTRRARVEAEISEAMRRLAALRNALAAIQSKTVYVTTIVNAPGQYGHPQGMAAGGPAGSGSPYSGAAGGGPRSNWTQVGEHGWEIAELPTGTRVHSHEDSQRMMSQGSGGPGKLIVEFRSDGSDQGMADLKRLQKTIRVYYGGDVQTAFGAI